jgi:predicted dehydrogenase
VCAALAVSPVAALGQVYDRDLALANDLAGQYGGGCADSLEALLEDPDVDAVYIAVPHASLAPTARLALQAGKPALVEKPMALTLAEADELIALAQARSLALGVFYELRYQGAFETAAGMGEQGIIGEVKAVRIQTLIDKPPSYWHAGYSGRSRDPWRARRAQAGGGVVLMNTSHLLDLVAYVTNLTVVRVSGEAANLMAPSDVEVEDTAVASLRFQNGAVGSLIAGAHFAGAGRGNEYFELYGTHGQMRLPDPYVGGPLRVFLREPWRDLPAGEWLELPTPETAVHQRALNDFAQAVKHGRPAPIDGRAARRVLATVLGLYTSAAEGRAVSLEEPVYAEH